jgi:predicted RNA-binding Zn ribbon-like protein
MKVSAKVTAAPGVLPLDFANTGARLKSYEELLTWCQEADIIGPNSRRNLSAGSDKAKAAALKEAETLSADLQILFKAAARDEMLSQKALDHLNAIVRETAAWRRIAACDDGGRKIDCGWDFKGAPPVAILGPIVWRAVELLETGPLDRVKECPADDCGWLFLDTSKNRSRQWCSMQTCGNVSKVRRFRERSKTA